MKPSSLNLLHTEEILSISFLCGSSYSTPPPLCAVRNVIVSFIHNELSSSPARLDSTLLRTLLSIFSLLRCTCRSGGLASVVASRKRNPTLARRISLEISSTHASKLSVLC